MKQCDYILASRSPRRKELLRLVVPEFTVQVSGVDESLVQEQIPERLVRRLATQKAMAVAREHPDACVIGCDTVVVARHNEILGIPQDAQDVRRMLLLLSGTTHRVMSGVCVCYQGKQSVFHKTTYVTFMPLSEEDIHWYLQTGEPFDKAGAYGIQGYGGLLVEKIRGDFYNVVGLPVQSLRKILQKMK